MIRKVVLRNFKRFQQVTFDVPGHVVLAGPNNTGKTTLLQAIAAWDLALHQWRLLDDRKKHGGSYTKAPIARQAFLSVPLRVFDFLWTDRRQDTPIEIEVHGELGWSLGIEFLADTTEQMYVRPTTDNQPAHVRDIERLETVFVPPISGVGLTEPLYANPETVSAFLAQFKAGDVLRNLLVEAARNAERWRLIQDSIRRLFGYELQLPNPRGAYILAEYRERSGGPTYDLTCAGSGFQQVLMLLCFLHTRPGSILLLDEPDAHLHVVLQDAIYTELRSVAARQNAQLIMATHSEVIINAANLDEIRLSFDPSRSLVAEPQRKALRHALRNVSNVDVMQAQHAPGVLYLEDYTDLEILRQWARTLQHPAYDLLTTKLFWRKTVIDAGQGVDAIQAREHYEALRLVRADLPGLMLVDGDSQRSIDETPITGQGLQRLRWRRYEIESYLVHPDVLARFVEQQIGTGDAGANAGAIREHFEAKYPRDFLAKPLDDYPFLVGTKARTDILPQALAAGELPAFPYQRFHEIAAVMTAAEIHPEVREKLDLLCKAFGVAV